MSGKGGTADLNESRRQALQGLISSLSGNSTTNDNLTSEQADKLSERLEQILGNGSIGGGEGSSGGPTLQRNENGQVLNEEGLPIIEITEPVEPSPPPPSVPAYEIHDHEPTPIAALNPNQKELLRMQREKILDALEREEELEGEKEVEQERVELDKRREAAKAEVDRLRAAREMQKKMGKALLRNIADAREREERQRQEDAANRLHAESSSSGEKSLKPRKSVTFAEPPKDGEEDKPNLQKMEKKMRWGDVSAGPVNGSTRQYLRNKSEMGKQPMRLEVVERIPGQPSEPTPEEHIPDSDDESIPDDDKPSRSHIPPWLRDDDAPFSPQRFSDDEDDESTPDVDDQDVDSEDDVDFDTVEHERQIFLEYNRLRGTIGADVVKAMSAHTHEEVGEDEWDQPDVPLEATLASKPAKPTMSRFKSSRISGRSTSLGGGPILPASQASTLKRAVQLGKLENGRLVGGEDDSDEDDGDESQRKEFLEMLKRGEIRNVGPTGNGVMDMSAPITERNTSTACTNKAECSHTQLPCPVPQKLSRFKQEISSGSGTPSDILAREREHSVTPLKSEARSSPKLSSTPPAGQVKERVTAKPPSKGFLGAPTVISTPGVKSIAESKLPVGEKPMVMPSMIVESPSFPLSGVKASAISTPSSSSTSTTPSHKQSPLATGVTERGSNNSMVGSSSTQRTEVAAPPVRVSRFKSERMQI